MTLRRWEVSGRLVSERTASGHRRYDLAKITGIGSTWKPDQCRTVAYARVSSADQKADLERQKQILEIYKDRLLRFGAEFVFAICQAKATQVVIINQGEETSFEEDLATDMLEIITVFSTRLYGSRSRKNRKLIDGVRKAVEDCA